MVQYGQQNPFFSLMASLTLSVHHWVSAMEAEKHRRRPAIVHSELMSPASLRIWELFRIGSWRLCRNLSQMFTTDRHYAFGSVTLEHVFLQIQLTTMWWSVITAQPLSLPNGPKQTTFGPVGLWQLNDVFFFWKTSLQLWMFKKQHSSLVMSIHFEKKSNIILTNEHHHGQDETQFHWWVSKMPIQMPRMRTEMFLEFGVGVRWDWTHLHRSDFI